MKRRYLGIDPGKEKCGLAVVEREGKNLNILIRKISKTSEIKNAVREIYDEFKPSLCVIGNGTQSKEVQTKVREEIPSISMLILDETDTSIRARERYWEHHPRRGWRRLLPSSLQVPQEPVDDFVAVILAETALSVD